MKKYLVFIALAALLLPPIIRGLWFYRGVVERPAIATPAFESFAAPQPPRNNLTQEDAKQLGGTALVDFSHGNRFMMTEITAFTEAIKQRGGQVELNNDPALLEYQLKSASAYIVISPSILFTPYEIQLVQNFVKQGGRVLVFTDATRNAIYYNFFADTVTAYGDVEAANPLLEPFDISINNDYLYNVEKNEGNFRNVFFDEFAKDELTFGLKQVAFYGSHSVESPSGLILLRGTDTTLSSETDAHDPLQGGAALGEGGNVAAFGDFTFLSPPYNAYADNAIFIQNLADFALSGNRTATLENFPFVFKTKTIQVYLAPGVKMTNSLISALGSLQTDMRFLGIQMEFTSKAPTDADAIIIGSLASIEDVEPFAKKFGFKPDENGLLTTAEFGKVNTSGNGLILLDAGKLGNRLILLAAADEDIISLVSLVNYGYLNSCLMQETVALCSVGYGDSYYDDTSDNVTETESEDKEIDPTPVPATTPQG